MKHAWPSAPTNGEGKNINELFLSAIMALAMSCPLWAADRAIAPSSAAEDTPGEKVASEDKVVKNFHAVELGTPGMKLYRSASPLRALAKEQDAWLEKKQTVADAARIMEHLKTLGIKTIVSLEDGNDQDPVSKEVKKKSSVALERDAAKNAGIDFLSHPMKNANFRTMSDKDIVAWLEGVKKDILAASAKGGVLFHCAAGHDRTGLSAAYLRITVQHWTAELAIKEMRDLGHNWPKYSSNGGKSSWHEDFLRRQFPAQTKPGA
jgi:protein tyrosine/serine phosphatase